ncbi:hypothetical protein OQA88_6499 [Cercophora sp. LCS_1]
MDENYARWATALGTVFGTAWEISKLVASLVLGVFRSIWTCIRWVAGAPMGLARTTLRIIMTPVKFIMVPVYRVVTFLLDEFEALFAYLLFALFVGLAGAVATRTLAWIFAAIFPYPESDSSSVTSEAPRDRRNSEDSDYSFPDPASITYTKSRRRIEGSLLGETIHEEDDSF